MRLFGAQDSSVTAAIGLIIVAIYLIVALLAPLIAPYGQDSITENAEPWIVDAQHWLGLDNLGRDIFSRLIFGARLSVGLSLIDHRAVLPDRHHRRLRGRRRRRLGRHHRCRASSISCFRCRR